MLKLACFSRNLQTSQADITRILRIKNEKFSRYCFYVNTYREIFKSALNVPLSRGVRLLTTLQPLEHLLPFPNLEVATKWLLHQQVKIPGQFQCHVGSMSLQLFQVVWIFLRPPGVICYDRLVLSEGLKNYFKDCCLINSAYLSVFDLFLSQ